MVDEHLPRERNNCAAMRTLERETSRREFGIVALRGRHCESIVHGG